MSEITPPTPAGPEQTSPKPDESPTVPLYSNPVEWPPETKSYLEDFITTVLPTSRSWQVLAQQMAYPIGVTPRMVMEDLTAQTGVYEWIDPVTGLAYLYLNGAFPNKADYPELYATWGANKWAADVGATFALPDTRGRELVLAGTHADCDLGDVFGPATESSRRGTKHGHAVTSASVTGAPSAGSAGTLAVASHTHGSGALTVTGAPDAGSLAITVPIGNNSGGGTAVKDDNASITRNQSGTVSGAPGVGSLDVGGSTDGATATITGSPGAPGLGTLDVGGTIGTDTNEGGAGIVIGSLVIRAL